MRLNLGSVVAGLLLAAVLQGCVSLLPPDNQPVTSIEASTGYRITESHRKPLLSHNSEIKKA